MTDIGMNEGLEVREGAEGRYFILWSFGNGAYSGNAYTVEVAATDRGVRALAPAMPGFVGEGATRAEAEATLIAAIKAYLYRLKAFLDVAEPLIPHAIAPDLYHPGEENVLIQPGDVSVWAIVGAMLASAPTEEQPGTFDRFITDDNIRDTARAYNLPPEAVRAAIAYYYWHRQSIDARIQANMVAV